MAKNLYRYSEESASYELAKMPFYRSFSFILSLGFLVVLLSGLFLWMSTKEDYDRQNQNLKAELDKVKLQYEVLNKKLAKTKNVLEAIEERDNNIYRAYFELDEIPEDVRKAGFGGVDRYERYLDLPFGELVADATRQVDILNNRLKLQSESLDEIVEAADRKEDAFAHIPAIQPINNKELKRLASGFGMRMHPILKIGRMHWGIDFKADPGTPIYATADGTVAKSERMGGYGNVVVLNHGQGYETLYAHMSKQAVVAGQKVKRGEVIGYVGNTGLSSGPHLHYEIKKDGEKVDPISYFYQDLSPQEYDELVKKAEEFSISLD